MRRRNHVPGHADTGTAPLNTPRLAAAGTLYVVAVPLSHPDDLTIRAARILESVEIIASEDPRATQALLAHHRLARPAAAPITSYHHDNRDEKTALLLDQLKSGHSVALVTDCGTPAIYDPGAFLVRAAAAGGIPVTPIPGPSALTAAVSVSGLEGDRIRFVGRLPATHAPRSRLLRELSGTVETLVIFLDPPHIRQQLADLGRYLGPRQACLCRNLGAAEEHLSYATLKDLDIRQGAASPATCWTIVIEGARSQSKTGRRAAGTPGPRSTRYSSSDRRRITTR